MSSLLNFHDPSQLRGLSAEEPDNTAADTVAENGRLDELKSQPVWICWNFRTRASEKDGKRTKVPCAASGDKTGTNDEYRDTWVTFDEAKAAAAEKHYSGVGFVIPEGYFFLDIDHKPLDDPYVVKMLERFGSYAERSVSGEGIHIYGKCDFSLIPTERTEKGRIKLDHKYYQKNPHNGTELYIGGLTNRFAVFTEDVIQNESLKECTNAILVTLNKDMLRQRDTTPNPPFEEFANTGKRYNGGKKQAAGNTVVNNVIHNLSAQKNREKFYQLFEEGDISAFGSQSEADLALCTMIAFRTGERPELIDSVFRKSALYREKWERDDYREATIQKAIDYILSHRAAGARMKSDTFEARKMTHASHHSTRPKPDFIKDGQDGNDYVLVPALARYVREHTRYLLVRDSGTQGVQIYVYEKGVYRYYDEKMFKGIIRDCIASYDEDLVKMHQVNEAYQNILTDRNYISQNDLNSREDVINFRNGMLVVREDSLELLPHSPEYYSTIQIPCDWKDRYTRTPVFNEFLTALTNGDNAVARLLLQFIGCCISNVKGWRMKKSLFLVGDGDTGKSQLKSLAERLLGSGNYIGIDLREIEARFGTGAIYGKRLAGSSDMSFMTVGELKTFKKVTGGDSLFAEFKGQQAFEYTYNGLLWFCMNQLPKFGGDDGKWVYNRIMVVNCPNVIPKEEQDKQLLDKMYAERDGITFLAVKALQKVIKNGYRFEEPECVIQARKSYMIENNSVISFFEECMCPWVNGKIQKACTTGKIYKVYQAWCRDNTNGYAKPYNEFRNNLAAYLDTTFDEMTVLRRGYRYYKEYGLTLAAKEQYHREYDVDGREDYANNWERDSHADHDD